MCVKALCLLATNHAEVVCSLEPRICMNRCSGRVPEGEGAPALRAEVATAVAKGQNR